MRWSFLPPLLVYFAAGISALTTIVGTFYVKEHLGFSAAFLTGLAFWAGIPWTLKVPLGHIVDLVWRWKSALIYLGAALIALSVAIMYGLIAHTARMAAIVDIEIWYVASVLLAPVGYVLQDVVADAMTVEAVPAVDERGLPYSEQSIKAMHTTMQTLGRVAIISGLVAVASLNIWMFAGVAGMSEDAKTAVYGRIYLAALIIPAVSVAGVVLAGIARRRRTAELLGQGFDQKQIAKMLFAHDGHIRPNWWILGGGAAFVVFIAATSIGSIPFNQEIVFIGSMAIVLFLMRELILQLPAPTRRALTGTAIIIFVFRAVPLPGPAATWWEIDALGFDQHFLSILTLITSCLALAGMLVLRPLMARRTIADVVIILSIASGVLSLPNIGLYYGLHEWTARHTGGIIDARFIAIMDTALESPLAQISMVPMLAWIAKNAPVHLKATFFAVMASFTNLALLASSLATKYLNEIFVVEREVRDQTNGEILVRADYGELGALLISAAAMAVLLPVIAIAAVQLSPWRTRQ